MDPWDLREAMLAMDSVKLPLDTVHKLINFVPTVDEAQLLDGYEKETNLGVAEKFVKIVRTVDKNLVERLKLWEFQMEFDELFEKQQQSLRLLRAGHDAIKQSASLKLMFTLILSIGNYMNSATSKGQAKGFKLSSLSQLMRSRTVDNSASLMEYLFEFVSSNEKYKTALKFTEDLQPLAEATKVDIATLKMHLAELRFGCFSRKCQHFWKMLVKMLGLKDLSENAEKFEILSENVEIEAFK